MKKITSILGKSAGITSVIKLKTGILEKKSDKSYTWAKRYTILNTKDLRYYYTENDFITKTD